MIKLIEIAIILFFTTMVGRRMTRLQKKAAAIAQMKELAKSLNVSDIAKEAERLFNEFFQKKIVISSSPYYAAFACLLYTMKRDVSCPPVAVREFLQALTSLGKEFKPKRIWKAYKKILEKKSDPPTLCSLRPVRFINPIARKLLLTKRAREIAKLIAKDAIKQGVHIGKFPTTIATACLYVAANLVTGENRTQQETARCGGITIPAMMNIVKHPFFENYDYSRFSEMYRSIEYYYSS